MLSEETYFVVRDPTMLSVRYVIRKVTRNKTTFRVTGSDLNLYEKEGTVDFMLELSVLTNITEGNEEVSG